MVQVNEWMATFLPGYPNLPRWPSPRRSPWLSQIEVPTLVVVGEHDVISTREEMETMADAIKGSRFVEIKGAGHMAPLERPAAFNHAVREFLK